MNELMLVLLLILTVFTVWYWLWRLAQYLWRPMSEWPKFSQIPIWRPRHPRVVIIAALVGLGGVIVGLQDPNAFASPIWRFMVDLAPEMVGMAFTVVVIDELNQIRIEQQRKQEIFEQLHSSVRDVAVEAVRLVRHYGWWEEVDGDRFLSVQWTEAPLGGVDLKGSYLRLANLEGANLLNANLEEVDLQYAKLKEAVLRNTNLRRANLGYANLKEAILIFADLEGANLQHVNLNGTNLCFANLRNTNLRNANLEGALYNLDTVWPEGFDAEAARIIEVWWDKESKEWIPVEE